MEIIKDIACALGHGGAFVLGMYSLKSTADNSQRNTWPVVLKRLAISSLVTCGSYYISSPTTSSSSSSSSSLTRFFLPKPFLPVKLVGVLFAGVLVEWLLYRLAHGMFFNDPEVPQKDVDVVQQVKQREAERNSRTLITVVRDLIAAPITEEIVFRGVIQGRCLEFAANHPIGRTFLSAFIFSLAHAHHGFVKCSETNKLVCRPKICLQHMAAPMMFGLLSGCLLEKGVGVLWIAAAHSFCNLVGPPKWGSLLMQDYAFEKEFMRDEERVEESKKFWNIFFPSLHGVCVLGFFYGIWKWE